MSELRNSKMAWPIPADRNPLKSEHLRGLALCVVATAAAGVGRLGWGLALPPARSKDAGPVSRVNEPTFSGGSVHVSGLSIVLPEGVYVMLDKASATLPESGCGVLGLIYTLPAHADAVDRSARVEPSLACFTNGDAAKANGATALAEIRSTGRGQLPLLRWLMPVLEIGAVPECATAATALSKAMLAAALAAGAHQRYEWQVVAAALRLAAAQPAETPPAPFNREVARALGGVVALARGTLSSANDMAHDAVATLATELDDLPNTGALPDALAAWFARLAAPVAESGPLMAWLRGTGTERQRLLGYPVASDIGRRLDRFDVAGAERVELRLSLRDPVAPMVLARIDGAPFSTLVLATVAGGFTGTLSLPDKAQYLDLDLPAEVEAKLHETVGGRENRS